MSKLFFKKYLFTEEKQVSNNFLDVGINGISLDMPTGDERLNLCACGNVFASKKEHAFSQIKCPKCERRRYAYAIPTRAEDSNGNPMLSDYVWLQRQYVWNNNVFQDRIKIDIYRDDPTIYLSIKPFSIACKNRDNSVDILNIVYSNKDLLVDQVSQLMGSNEVWGFSSKMVDSRAGKQELQYDLLLKKINLNNCLQYFCKTMSMAEAWKLVLQLEKLKDNACFSDLDTAFQKVRDYLIL